MASQPCPHCKQATISWWQKYIAAKWVLIKCSACAGTACSNPYILVFYTMLYVWDVLLFGYVAYFKSDMTFILIMIVGWLILDYFSLFLPLSAMKRSAQPSHSP